MQCKDTPPETQSVLLNPWPVNLPEWAAHLVWSSGVLHWRQWFFRTSRYVDKCRHVGHKHLCTYLSTWLQRILENAKKCRAFHVSSSLHTFDQEACRLMPLAHAVSVYCPNTKISQFSKVFSFFELQRIRARSRKTKANGVWGLKVKLFCHQLLHKIINPQKLIGVGCLMTKLWKLSWKKYIQSICQPIDSVLHGVKGSTQGMIQERDTQWSVFLPHNLWLQLVLALTMQGMQKETACSHSSRHPLLPPHTSQSI